MLLVQPKGKVIYNYSGMPNILAEEPEKKLLFILNRMPILQLSPNTKQNKTSLKLKS
ncbi:hypothetical protein ADIARSV_1245 [Arcticibacter svalbardensis MN12-7]|uniref:Uncharacterized protein n=1 Tax=Arcticibacter svalbardensis MN12-7 TaxID=1150600 RepID=R9GUN3_9SPHI|nr:hypothetical protein ADIARSV_1245 [Arcticibacter svalbardensis MN12-7]